MLRSDWVPRRIQYVAAPTMDAMYRKVMDRNNQWASNTDPEAMIVLRERLRAVVPVTSPARRVASAGRGGGAAAAGVASTVSDAADQTKCGACTSDDVPVGPHGYVIACKQCNKHYHSRCVLFGMARDDFSGHYICDHCIATKRGSPGLPSSNPTIGSKRDAPPPPTAECSKPKRNPRHSRRWLFVGTHCLERLHPPASNVCTAPKQEVASICQHCLRCVHARRPYCVSCYKPTLVELGQVGFCTPTRDAQDYSISFRRILRLAKSFVHLNFGTFFIIIRAKLVIKINL